MGSGVNIQFPMVKMFELGNKRVWKVNEWMNELDLLKTLIVSYAVDEKLGLQTQFLGNLRRK